MRCLSSKCDVTLFRSVHVFVPSIGCQVVETTYVERQGDERLFRGRVMTTAGLFRCHFSIYLFGVVGSSTYIWCCARKTSAMLNIFGDCLMSILQIILRVE